VTCLEPIAPIFWRRAAGANVWDVDGNRFVDLGGGFGVANLGHGHPRVIEAVTRQSDGFHAMGTAPPRWWRCWKPLVCTSPAADRPARFSAREATPWIALKTAMIATHRPGVVAFEGAYHGLGLGALDSTWRPFFKEPFQGRLPGCTAFARYGDAEGAARAAARCAHPVGAVLVEPIQGRGGERVPPRGFLRELRRRCDEETSC
jgi:4-aminobutyrate aminotransferase/(S)-3-amino-2-methylpropionate transaminase